MQTLRSEIEARQLPLGGTSTGKDWCIKALHPSDPMTEVRGIPDHSAVPSLLMNYQATLTFGPAAGSTGTWSFNSSLIPHPINFYAYTVVDSVNPGGVSSEYDNPQITGATHSAKYAAFTAMAQRWRLAYCAVTIHQDGPSLANQGSIVVSQPVVQPYVDHYCSLVTALNKLYSTCRVQSYGVEDYPDFNTSQSMPNAYFARSKEGVYVPLKLTETCQDWVSDADAITPEIHRWGGTSTNVQNSTDAAALYAWPHWDTECVLVSPSADLISQVRTSPLLNASVAHICAENLSVDTRFTCFFRYGIEMQVSPTSSLAPQLKLSPAHDSLALDAYFSIARELKDGFPADYNDLGKIWDNISAAAQNVLPYLKQMGPYGKALSYGGRAVITAGDAVRAKRQSRKKKTLTKPTTPPAPPRPPLKPKGDRGNPPAAAIERAQAVQSLKDMLADLATARSSREAARKPT